MNELGKITAAVRELHSTLGSAQKLADSIGVSLKTVQRWGAGEFSPKPAALVKLYKAALDNHRGDLAAVFIRAGQVMFMPERSFEDRECRVRRALLDRLPPTQKTERLRKRIQGLESQLLSAYRDLTLYARSVGILEAEKGPAEPPDGGAASNKKDTGVRE